MSTHLYNSLSNHNVAMLFKAGSIAVIPTDTQYGVVGDASNEAAVTKLYATKKGDKKPGTVIAASIDQLAGLGLKRRYLTAVADFWPNPLSIIIPTGPELGYLHAGKYSLAVRIPRDEKLLALLKKTGPLMTTSANKPGKNPVATIQEAQKVFGDAVDFYVDGGDRKNQKPSTVIRMIDDAIEVLREGAVVIDEKGTIAN